LKDTIVTGRRLSPLNPIYELPKVDLRPHTPPKFIRDSIQVDVESISNGYRILMEQDLKRAKYTQQETQ
jgi:hypothetical protein